MNIHDLNTKTLTDPAYVAFDDGSDTYKTEFNDVVEEKAAAAIAATDLTQNTVAFTSGDAASPTAWTNVSVITTGSTLATLFNRISTMVKNVRFLKTQTDAINTKSAQVLDANWLNMNCVKTGNGVKFIRCSTYPNANMTGGTEYNVGMLQTDYRPTYAVSHYVKWGGGSTAFGLLKITQEGAVTFTPDINISTSTGININFAFI